MEAIQEKIFQTPKSLIFPNQCLVCGENLTHKHPMELGYPVCSEMCYKIYATWQYRRRQCLTTSHSKTLIVGNANCLSTPSTQNTWKSMTKIPMNMVTSIAPA
ncbi:MAG: hypothetical protein EOM19_05795 [Candidatus Moranbacteria bacterium]|nr:hypothetical protein [Candidatus Moranbacteria bacterium]